jgi:hypothetical protein
VATPTLVNTPDSALAGRLLSDDDRHTLERWVRSPTVAQRVALRSRILLALDQGTTGRAAARALGISRTTVDLWRHRFLVGGCQALCRDKPGRGRKPRAVAEPDRADRSDYQPNLGGPNADRTP